MEFTIFDRYEHLGCFVKEKIEKFIYLSKPLTMSVVGRGGGGPTP